MSDYMNGVRQSSAVQLPMTHHGSTMPITGQCTNSTGAIAHFEWRTARTSTQTSALDRRAAATSTTSTTTGDTMPWPVGMQPHTSTSLLLSSTPSESCCKQTAGAPCTPACPAPARRQSLSQGARWRQLQVIESGKPNQVHHLTALADTISNKGDTQSLGPNSSSAGGLPCTYSCSRHRLTIREAAPRSCRSPCLVHLTVHAEHTGRTDGIRERTAAQHGAEQGRTCLWRIGGRTTNGAPLHSCQSRAKPCTVLLLLPHPQKHDPLPALYNGCGQGVTFSPNNEPCRAAAATDGAPPLPGDPTTCWPTAAAATPHHPSAPPSDASPGEATSRWAAVRPPVTS
jgi:hypothetical protein